MNMDSYNFSLAFCLVLVSCGYDTFEAERILKEFRKTYGIAVD